MSKPRAPISHNQPDYPKVDPSSSADSERAPATTATSSGDLEQFDLISIMIMLAQSEKTGLLAIAETPHSLECWITKGRIVHLKSGELLGVPALTLILSQLASKAQGKFLFQEREAYVQPSLDIGIDTAIFQGLVHLPEKPLPCKGPARFTDSKRIASMEWKQSDQEIVLKVNKGMPLSDIAKSAKARSVLWRLSRLGLLRKRKARTARLTLTLTHDVIDAVVIDQKLLKRWQNDLGRRVAGVAICTDEGYEYSFLVKQSPDLGADMLVPPDIFIRNNLYANDPVLVRPL